jgi:hypothetical protein
VLAGAGEGVGVPRFVSTQSRELKCESAIVLGISRIAGFPAIAIGCLDENGLAPRSHQPADATDAIDRTALDATLELALMLVDAIDAELSALRGKSSEAASALTRPDRTRRTARSPDPRVTVRSHRRDGISPSRPVAALAGGEREAPHEL